MLTGTTSTQQNPGCNLTPYFGPLAVWGDPRRASSSFFFSSSPRQGGVDGVLWVRSVVTLSLAGWKEGETEGLASGWRGTKARG